MLDMDIKKELTELVNTIYAEIWDNAGSPAEIQNAGSVSEEHWNALQAHIDHGEKILERLRQLADKI